MKGLFVILALIAAVPLASAMGGYGTSSISVSQSAMGIGQGATGNINYTVNLASGNTWGTNLAVVNQASLSSRGITVTVSNPSGDPPYSGYLTITTSSSATEGQTQIVLQATGDDPSTTNTTITLNVIPQIVSVTNSSTTTTTTNSSSTTSTPYPTTSTSGGQNGYTTTVTVASYGSLGNMMEELGVAIAVILIIAAFLLYKIKSLVTRLGIIGIAMILIGTAAWLYGDFAGGLFNYIYAGIGIEILGIIIWIIGDAKAGAFKSMKGMATMLDLLGILLLIIGNGLWLYADFYGGSLTYVWAGVALILLGTLVWIIGDWKAGAFVMKK